MERLRMRFEQKRGHFMIIEDEPPFTEARLNELQLRMLQICEIPGLLPLEIERKDGNAAMRYALRGTRMLSEAMRFSSWSMREMLGTLCRLAEILEDVRLYMLDAERISLRDEHIFIGKDGQDLRMVYLPTNDPVKPLSDGLERLVVRWLTKVADPDGNAMREIVKLIGHREFTLLALIRLLRKLLSNKPEMSVGEAGVRESAISSSLSQETGWPPERGRRGGVPQSGNAFPVAANGRRIEENADNEGRHDSVRRQSPLLWDGLESDEEASPSRETEKRWGWLLGCAALLTAIAAWRLSYMNEPNGPNLAIASTATAAAALAFALLRRRMPPWAGEWLQSKEARGDGSEEEEKESVARSIVRSELHEADSRDAGDQATGLEEPEWRQKLYPASALRREDREPESEPGMELSEEADNTPATSWLTGQADATTLLKSGGGAIRKPQFVLEWETDRHGSRIALNGSSLVIGRNAEAAQHVDSSPGISRAHLELTGQSGEWKARDLGSRNGSRLNGSPMTAYESYALQTGDSLTLADSRYRFLRENGS